jgi:radical SAM protein with 4Fe4S-binding SPASM domain
VIAEGCQGNVTPGSKEHLDEFRRTTYRQRIPLAGSLDLTHRCNLRCVHCYLGPQENHQADPHQEMTTRQVCELLTQAANAGCLYLLISGGEPLLRQDFPAVYRHARELGMVVTVFTNATLISEGHLELFAEYPPRLVEVSVYGATKETYEAVTRVPNSFERCIRGIHRMIERGIRVGIKTIVMGNNLDEVPLIEEMARELGTPFRLDALICPRLDGGTEPLQERVSPDRAVQLEFADVKRFEEFRRYFQRVRHLDPPETLYQCGAGVTNFYVDPRGILRPCLMTTTVGYDALELGFSTAWKAAVTDIGNLRVGVEHECQKCVKRSVCGYCPGLFTIETGAGERPVSYLCELGNLRFEIMEKSLSLGEGGNAN